MFTADKMCKCNINCHNMIMNTSISVSIRGGTWRRHNFMEYQVFAEGNQYENPNDWVTSV